MNQSGETGHLEVKIRKQLENGGSQGKKSSGLMTGDRNHFFGQQRRRGKL